MTKAIKYQAFAAVIAQQTRPGFVPAIHGILRGSLMDGLTRPPATSPAAEPLTEQEWTDRIADKAGAPFSDAGPVRLLHVRAQKKRIYYIPRTRSRGGARTVGAQDAVEHHAIRREGHWLAGGHERVTESAPA